MSRISIKARQLFKQWGRRGGKTRARNLSSNERSMIAAGAARARWKKPVPPLPLQSIRLQDARLNDPVYLEELLSDGTWEDWKGLYQIILDRPFGDASIAVKKVCSSVKMYGVSILWQGIIRSVRGGIL